MLNPKDPNYLDLCDEYRKQSKEGNGMERTAVGHPWEVRGQEIYDANGIWVGEVNVPDRIVRAVNRDHVFDALVEALESVLRDDGVVLGPSHHPDHRKGSGRPRPSQGRADVSKLPYTVIIRCLPLGVEDLEHYSKTCAVCDEVSVKPSMRIPSPGKPKTPHYACENEACEVGHFEVRSLLTYRTDVAAASDEGALSQGKELFHHADCDPVVGIFGTVVDVRVLRTELADTAGEGGDPLRGPMFNKRSKGAAG